MSSSSFIKWFIRKIFFIDLFTWNISQNAKDLIFIFFESFFSAVGMIIGVGFFADFFFGLFGPKFQITSIIFSFFGLVSYIIGDSLMKKRHTKYWPWEKNNV